MNSFGLCKVFYDFKTGIVIRINGTNVIEVRCNVARCIVRLLLATLKVLSSIRRECNGEKRIDKKLERRRSDLPMPGNLRQQAAINMSEL